MSGRFRRRSGFRYNGYRSGRRRFGRSNQIRRARGNLRAAANQNDTSDVVINLMHKVKAGVTGLTLDGTNRRLGTVALNVFELLRKSDFYKSYANMYDQIRINSIKVKVTPVQWKTYDQFNIPYGEGQNPAVPAGNYIYPQALTVVTAWDRTGLNDSQIYKNGNYQYITIGDDVSMYSSAKSSQLVAGANFSCTRYLYPSSNQEKSLFFSTADLFEQITTQSDGEAWYRSIVSNDYNSYYVTNIQSDASCPFKPTFILGILSVDPLEIKANEAETTNKINPVTFNLEFDIGVTFRGLRKAQVVV